MLVDTHCHLDFPEFDEDRNEVIKRARDAGIDYIINIGSSVSGSKKSLELSKAYDFIYATVGLHPHEADKFDGNVLASIEELARKDKVVAIGETGLDYYLPAGRQGKNYSDKERQKLLFKSLIKLAKELSLPLVIHNRKAHDDILKILKEIKSQKIVVHCFSGSEDFLRDCLDLGFFISFTCNITYRNALGLRDLVKAAPLNKILLETDAPFLPPEGFRGKRNEPLYVKYLATEIAKIKETDVETVAKITTENTKRFFNLK